jgi:hypothetical protein
LHARRQVQAAADISTGNHPTAAELMAAAVTFRTCRRGSRIIMPSPRLMCLPVPSGKGESFGGERRFWPFGPGSKQAETLKIMWKIQGQKRQFDARSR